MNDDASLKESQSSDRERLHFEFLADMGFTKHIGDMVSTEELIEACHIDESKYVLDVGCRVGLTPCYLPRTYGCHVVGVDVTANAHSITYRSEAFNRLRRIGWKEMASVFYRFFAVALREPVYKGFMKDALTDPRAMME